ncbi:mRNA-decapping enzyme subunit 1 [Rhizoctonia solani 123E]|uniref:mRNA-decapping enzyme subunit 1 n=1 Tax=Rhizoctonia solani 123E TaxID=1423351 RepID=A0A074RWK6_9AGAM|nr:mRNA-decapping enzyme subunit 1 [Rhizoctonia solani 123E]
MPHETSMSAASRKAWNLKVIQRHDPDIICIWDQVSYVMLMQYSGSQWSKTSVEGSLFLFDRRGFPRYGFFILNRSSSHNYIHLLTPEDNLEVRENYVIFRAKGSKDAPVMGLWASDPDHRNHLGETLLGLHAHIKSGSTEAFYNATDVYGGDQTQPAVSSPPPAITTTTNYVSPAAASSSSGVGQSTNEAGGMQSLNDLFARLSSSASVNSVTTAPATAQTTLYSSQTGQAPAASNSTFALAQAPAQPTPAPTGPLRGQALLDSLFAMASPTRTPAVVQPTPTNLSASGSFTIPQSQSSSTFSKFGAPAPSAPTNSSQPATQSPTSSKGGDLLAQLFANIGTGPQQSTSTQSLPPTAQTHNIRHSRAPSTPPSVMSTLPADPAIIHSAKVTPEPKSERRRNNTRRGYATDTSPRPHHSHSHSHRMSVFDEDATHSRSTSQAADDVLTALNGSVRNKPRVGRALVPFQSDTGPVYHPDPTRPHVSNRFPAGENGEEEKIYAQGIDEEAEDEIFYDGRGNRGKGPSPKRQRRRRNGRGGANGSEGRNGDVVNLDRQIAGDALMQGIEWDEGVVDKQLFLQSIHALLNEPEFVDQLYNDYKTAQTQRAN